jgi:hypothetical protein
MAKLSDFLAERAARPRSTNFWRELQTEMATAATISPWKDNSRLQSEVGALRSTLRRGAPLDDIPIPPAEAANDETPPAARRGKTGQLSEAGGKG